MSPHKVLAVVITAAALTSAGCGKRDNGLPDSTAARVDSTMAAPGATPAATTDSSTLRDPIARDSARRADSMRTADSAKRAGRGGTP